MRAARLPLLDAQAVVDAAREAERGELVGGLLGAVAGVAVEHDVARGAAQQLRRDRVAWEVLQSRNVGRVRDVPVLPLGLPSPA